MIEIIEFKKEFLNDIADIEQNSFARPWSKAMLLSSAANNNIDFDIVLNESKVIGYSIVSYAGAELEIQSLAIAKEYRRKHNGRALLDFVLAKAAKKGVQTAFLEVRKSNTAAFNLYKSFGFELLAIREKYYKDEDALVLRKTLK